MPSSVKKKKRLTVTWKQCPLVNTWHSIERTNKKRQVTLIITWLNILPSKFVCRLYLKAAPQHHTSQSQQTKSPRYNASTMSASTSVSDSRLLTKYRIVLHLRRITFLTFNFIPVILHLALLVINLISFPL